MKHQETSNKSIEHKELLSELDVREEEQDREFLFTDRNGELLKYNAIQVAFNKGFKALNLPWRSTHILRHSSLQGL